ncbi:hypothetical protein [Candidatus Ichthyocystis sparus]|uniref:hypothetical protein n=1 Tax=Candidatus Ichthyocystis sparus TaxID=1561004 RepID=UPI000B837BC8|nr:hypothetical protein [Candidatus Ichthyocystis sparus]
MITHNGLEPMDSVPEEYAHAFYAPLEKAYRKENIHREHLLSNSNSAPEFDLPPTVEIFALDGFSQNREGEEEEEEEEEKSESDGEVRVLSQKSSIGVMSGIREVMPTVKTKIRSSRYRVIGLHSLLVSHLTVDSTLLVLVESVASAFLSLGLTAFRIAPSKMRGLPATYNMCMCHIAATSFSISHSLDVQDSVLPNCDVE